MADDPKKKRTAKTAGPTAEAGPVILPTVVATARAPTLPEKVTTQTLETLSALTRPEEMLSNLGQQALAVMSKAGPAFPQSAVAGKALIDMGLSPDQIDELAAQGFATIATAGATAAAAPVGLPFAGAFGGGVGTLLSGAAQNRQPREEELLSNILMGLIGGTAARVPLRTTSPTAPLNLTRQRAGVHTPTVLAPRGSFRNPRLRTREEVLAGVERVPGRSVPKPQPREFKRAKTLVGRTGTPDDVASGLADVTEFTRPQPVTAMTLDELIDAMKRIRDVESLATFAGR